MSWSVETRKGTAQELHDAPAPTLTEGGLVVFNKCERDALVLGSAQSVELVDPGALEASNVELVKRSTGGGIVYIDAAADLWIDFYLPASDERTQAHLEGSFDWLGHLWLEAIGETNLELSISSSKPSSPTSESGLYCFGSPGFGEVCSATHKIVGISQRRTRDFSKFQCLYSPTAGIGGLGLIGREPDETDWASAGLPDADFVLESLTNQLKL